MAEASRAAPARSDQVEPHLIEYRRISGWAVVGLALGIASVVVLIWPVLWPLPVFGTLASALALHFIVRAGGALLGRRAALAGLALSLLFLASVPAQAFTTRWWLIRESDAAATEWFAFLLRGEPARAEQCTQPPGARHSAPSEHELRKFYASRPSLRKSLDEFIAGPVVRTLLQLDDKAQARLYLNEEVKRGDAQDVVKNVYAITFDDGGKKKSFFVRVVLRRTRDPETGQPHWQVIDHLGPVKPGVSPEQQAAQ